MFIEKVLVLIVVITTIFLRHNEPTYSVELCILFGTGMILGALGHIAKILTRR